MPATAARAAVERFSGTHGIGNSLTPDRFERLMQAFAPFETGPVVAVGVSGGADSMALVLLADRWARGRGGRAIGLTVDHGLRAASAGEAESVAAWLAARSIEHHVLEWRYGVRPATGVQARAREARRSLLSAWCRENGVLHLLLAHHEGDQAETVAMREKRSSAGPGLSGMAPVHEVRDVRILRPLLTVPRADLEQTLRDTNQGWIDDPSNADRRFERVRVRQALARESGAEGVRRRILAEQSSIGRAALDDSAARTIGVAVSLNPAGFARIDRRLLHENGAETARSVLSRVIRTIAGNPYPPRAGALERVHARLLGGAAFPGSTLGGCRLVGEGAQVLVCREPAAIGPDVAGGPGETVEWDGRFRIRLGYDLPAASAIGALGADGWHRIKGDAPPDLAARLPHAVRLGLPALRRGDDILAVPHLTYRRAGTHAGTDWIGKIEPVAAETMTNARFFVASRSE